MVVFIKSIRVRGNILETVNKDVLDKPTGKGETSLNASKYFKKVLLKNSIIPESENDTAPIYSAKNSELDKLLGEETATIADTATQEIEQVKQDKPMISSKKAVELAVAGLQELCNGVAEHSGRQLKFGSTFVKLLSCALAPVIQKYSRHIDVDPDNVDLDSWKPELLALGSLTALGGSTFMQFREPIEHDKGGKSGDKS